MTINIAFQRHPVISPVIFFFPPFGTCIGNKNVIQHQQSQSFFFPAFDASSHVPLVLPVKFISRMHSRCTDY